MSTKEHTMTQTIYYASDTQNKVAQAFRKQLFALQDVAYKDFQSKLIPSISPDSVIGIRTPQLRKLAKELTKTPEAKVYLTCLPHTYYDENNLHGLIIENMKDYEEVIAALDAFLPYVDNWATCDIMAPKAFKKHLPELAEKIEEWLSSEHTYMVRFGIGMLLKYYLDENFDAKFLKRVASIQSEEYYIKMMIAWYFATALAKQYDAAIPYLTQERLPVWIHNKTIQKAIESYRITDEQKIYLRTLKR